MTFLPLFSHIYIEDAAREFPLTERILARFPNAQTIAIQNYKEVFNRPRQRWEHQRQSLKLILAARRDAFLYPGSSFVPNFDHTRFFYTTPILNCIYGCEYCYLQGLLSSPTMVAFVNHNAFTEAAALELRDPTPAYVCISYDTDLLAIEDIFGYCADWIEFARSHPHVTIEIRTKSANIRALDHISPPPNVILAWTLSPADVVKRFEHKTPSLQARLKAIAQAQALNWRVRLCFDPILRVNEWQKHYQELVETTFSAIEPQAITDVSLGVFRINSGYLRTMQEQRPDSKLVTYPYRIEHGSASYTDAEREEMITHVSQHTLRFIPKEKLCPVPWQW